MKIWLVERTDDDRDYDETWDYVCAAPSPVAARRIGESLLGDQPPSIWYVPTTKVRQVGTALPSQEEGVILAHFNAG